MVRWLRHALAAAWLIANAACGESAEVDRGAPLGGDSGEMTTPGAGGTDTQAPMPAAGVGGGGLPGPGGAAGDSDVSGLGGAQTPPSDGSAGSGDASALDYYPTDAWRSRSAEEAGLDPVALERAVAYATELPTEALLVVRGGYIVAELYERGFSQMQRHESYSMAKSLTSTLIGIAIDQGLVDGVDARVCAYYASWDCENTDDPRSRITLAHLLTLSSGLEWQEDWEAGVSLTNDAIRMSSAPLPMEYVLDKPAAVEPGTRFQYSTGDPALLSGVLQQATGMTAYQYAQQEILGPLGMSGATWNQDADGNTTTFAGLQATAREFAKFGLLFLNRGVWEGEQRVPEAWIDQATRPGVSLVDWYGLLWHVNAPSRWDDPALPADGYAAIGVFGQHIIILPSQDIVIVRLANDGLGSTEFDAGELIRRVVAAL